METIDKLFEDAKQISDKRAKIFNELIKRAENELIPRFAGVLNGYDIKRSYFTVNDRPFSGFSSQEDEDGEKIYCFAIDNGGKIWEAYKDSQNFDKYSVCGQQYRLNPDNSDTNLPVATFTRVAIVKIVKLLIDRIEKLNNTYYNKNAEAEALLK